MTITTYRIGEQIASFGGGNDPEEYADVSGCSVYGGGGGGSSHMHPDENEDSRTTLGKIEVGSDGTLILISYRIFKDGTIHEIRSSYLRVGGDAVTVIPC